MGNLCSKRDDTIDKEIRSSSLNTIQRRVPGGLREPVSMAPVHENIRLYAKGKVDPSKLHYTN